MRAFTALALIGCGAASHGDTARGALVVDATAIAKSVNSPVVYGGLWFADASCRFEPGTIDTAKLAAFAKCLQGLGLQASTRKHALPDTALFMYGPGLEVEARFVASDNGTRLSSIGYVGGSATPTITPTAFEALGSHELVFDDAARSKLETEPDSMAWLKICIAATGEISDVHVIEATSPMAADAFIATAKAWKLQPFKLGDRAMPVCTVRRFVYAATTSGTETVPLPPVEEAAAAVPPDALGDRLSGTEQIAPDGETKIEIARAGNPSLSAGLRYCLDATGKVTAVKIVASTGIATYDRQLVAGVSKWLYKPYGIEGKALPVCSSVVIRYSQEPDQHSGFH